MNCNNCTNNNALKEVKIKHVHGNVLRMAIPLTLRTIELVDGEINTTDTPFVPSSEHPVKVVFSKGSVSVALDATMKDGNIAYIEEKGKIPVGTYAITVTCNDDNGNPYRFKQNAVLYVADATIEAGIEETIEYEVTTWYLDAAIFLALKGEDGVGIDDIETQSSGEIGGVNTVTFILTDGRTRSFTILNGSGAVDSDLDINSPSPIANSAVTAKFNELSGELADLFGDVDYDTLSKTIRFWDKGKTNVLASLDARPFIKDGMVSNAYISNNTLVITFNTDSGKEAIGVPLTSVFNPNNYYTKTQVDSRIASAVANINLTNYYTKSQTDTMVSRITPYEVTFTIGNNSNIVCDHTIANIYQNYTNHKPIIAKYGESVGTLVYIKGGENPEAAFLFGDRYDSPYLLRNGVSGWGKEELGADIEVEPWPSIESDKPVASDGVAAALAQKVSSVTINGTTKTPDEDGDVSFTVEGGSGGYEPPIGGIPKTDLAQSVQDTLDDVSNKVDKVAGKGLSTEDYTTAEKQKLAGLSNYDDTEIQAEVDAKYEKPSTGIPKTDLASDVQASLGKADTALQSSDLEGYATTDDVDDAVAALVSSAPQTLDTLNELADALGDDPNFATTMATQLGNKVDKETGKGLSTNDYTTAEKTKLAGLENYDDSALQTAIDGKVDKESGKSLMTDAERTKLQGIAAGAEVNVQPNWTQTTTTADDYIKNKPTLATVATSGSYNDLQDRPNIPAGVTVDQSITQNGTNPVRGSAIYSALANKANINGSVDIDFNASTLQACSNDEGVMMSAVYSDDEMRLLFTGSADGGSLNYIFDGSGSAKTIATTADIASCVPTTRKINNKLLSTDITLNASDVGALPASTTIPTKVSDLTNDSGFTSNSPATATPSMDGTANVGSSAKYAREDHVHPHDSTKQDTLTFDSTPTASSTKPVTSGGIKTYVDAKATITDITTNQDGTFTIALSDGNSYTVNLNHVHPQYLKYELLADEAAYNALATKDSSTLYLIPEE